MPTNYYVNGTPIDNMFVDPAPLTASKGYLYIWGVNSSGQLGDYTSVNKSTPTLMSTNTGGWADITNRGSTTIGLKLDGTLWSWGYGGFGTLGDLTITDRSSPVQITSLGNSVAYADATNHVVAVKTDGTIWSWGRNTWGQVGDGFVTNRSSPVQIGATLFPRFVTTGAYATAVITTANELYIAGIYSCLPDGTSASKSVLTQIPGTNWKSVAFGMQHGLGLKQDGTLWVWGGDNGTAVLGMESGIPASNLVSTPVQIMSGITWKSVHAGPSTSAAIDINNNLYIWGYNNYGMLGLGDSTTRSTPVLLAGKKWKDIAMSAGETVLLAEDNTIWACGFNNAGQLGLGDTTNRSSPVQVSNTIRFKQLTKGVSSNIGIIL